MTTGGDLAAIVSVGDELLTGRVVDSNAAEIARALRGVGRRVASVQVVGDDEAAIADAVTRAASQASWVIVTGGLGPTPDDLTREGLARAMGESLVTDAGALDHLERSYRARGAVPSASNRRQAMRPGSAASLPNDVGTAPGILATVGAARVYVLPGVPMEMRHLLAAHVVPGIGAGGALPAILERAVLIHGLPESEVGDRLGDLMSSATPRVGITVEGGVIQISLSAPAESAAELERARDEVAARFWPDAFGRDGDTLESVLVGLCRARGLTVATAESCTGGLVAESIVRVSGASEMFAEGMVTYSNEAKMRRLGVSEATLRDHGAVSAEVVEEMARGVASASGADLAISVSGVAGPTGGTPDKPVGLVWFGLWDRGQVSSVERRFLGDRAFIRLRGARTALDLLRRAAL